jgi:Ran GTPase-activating protein 1
LLAAITASNPSHICLSNKSFDNAAATKIAAYLDSLSSVTVADVSDIIAGRPEDEALRTLKIICSSLEKFELVEVNLSDNALGAKGVEACKGVLLGDKIEVRFFFA